MVTVQLNKGFTLIEAMVTLLIFSAGLLGLAGMQMSGMQNSNSALLHSIAIQQTYDYAERIRANLANAADYYDQTKTSVTCVKDETPCTSIPDRDFQQWFEMTKNVLPSGDASVAGQSLTIASTNDSHNFVITVQWTQPSGQSASVSLNFQP